MMGTSSQTGPLKVKFFNLLSYAHKIFKVSKHKKKIKFDIIWWYQNGVSHKTGRQNCNFLTSHVRHMKFSEWANMKKRQNLTIYGGTEIGDHPETWLPKFWTFKPFELEGSNFRNGEILKIILT